MTSRIRWPAKYNRFSESLSPKSLAADLHRYDPQNPCRSVADLLLLAALAGGGFRVGGLGEVARAVI
jgi:hypothetical protein